MSGLPQQPSGDDDGEPFAWGDAPRSVILIHGLTGTPWEVRPFGRALHGAGYTVEGPLLAGHDDLDALERCTWSDWLASVETVLDRHRAAGRTVVLLGFSMGGLLALLLAARRPADVAGLVTISVPLELPGWQRRAISGLSRLRRQPLVGRFVGRMAKSDGPDLRIQDARRRSPSLRAFPYPALAQLVSLQSTAARELGHVRAPMLILHGRHDHVAPVEHSARLAQAVASPEVRRVLLPRSFHIVGRDLDREQACQEVVRFVSDTLGPATGNDHE